MSHELLTQLRAEMMELLSRPFEDCTHFVTRRVQCHVEFISKFHLGTAHFDDEHFINLTRFRRVNSNTERPFIDPRMSR